MADKPKLPWLTLTRLTPQAAHDWFSRKQLVTSFSWKDVWEAEHIKAATVAGMLREDLLATVYDHLGEAIKEGHDARWFERELTPILQAAGWWGKKQITDFETGETAMKRLGSPARLRLIYDVNVRSAYAAGRWEEAQATKKTAPLMMYRTMRDERVRAAHAAWDGLVLPIDDPFWDTHYPPNGYRCRCIAVPISEAAVRDMQQAGLKVRRTAPTVTYGEFERNGQIVKVPHGIDPGFGYNVGKQPARGVEALYKQKRDSLPPAIKAAGDAARKEEGGS